MGLAGLPSSVGFYFIYIFQFVTIIWHITHMSYVFDYVFICLISSIYLSYMYICIYIYIYIYTYVYVCVCMYIYIYIYMHLFIYMLHLSIMYMYIYIYIYIHIHIFMLDIYILYLIIPACLTRGNPAATDPPARPANYFILMLYSNLIQ